jgi:hypothetical protein
MRKTVLFALATAVAGAAVAQDAARPDPKDPSAAVPAFTYRSAFEGYRPFVEQGLQDWRKTNEEVAAVSGHKGPMAGQNEPVRPPAKPSTPAPTPQGHERHK